MGGTIVHALMQTGLDAIIPMSGSSTHEGNEHLADKGIWAFDLCRIAKGIGKRNSQGSIRLVNCGRSFVT
jgi:hypothetical protein